MKQYDLMIIGPATRDVNVDYTGAEDRSVGGAVTFCTAAAKAAQAASQADRVPESRPPPKLVSLGGLYSLHNFTSAAFSAASRAYILSSGGAMR